VIRAVYYGGLRRRAREAGRADDESGDQQDPGPSRGTGVDPVVRGLDVVRALGEQRDALEHPEAATDDDQDCGEDRARFHAR